MIQAFRKAKLDKNNLKKLDRVNEIIHIYSKMGYVLTLRQLYYRLVTTNVIENNTKEYAKLIHLLTEGRMGGIVDWEGIEDRVRVPNLPYYNYDINDAVSDANKRYRLERQKGQKFHVELWVEKDAISNILKVRTHHYGIYLMVNRGFSSTTAMYESYRRMSEAIEEGKTPKILYLGDHDPSGLCMALNDIPDRLNQEFGVPVDVEHIGITMEQIKKYNPPTNPAKITDSRSKWYIKNWGDHSWEVDALEPKVLHELINEKVEGYMDMDLFKKVLVKEKEDKIELNNLINNKSKLDEIVNILNSFDNKSPESRCSNGKGGTKSNMSNVIKKSDERHNVIEELKLIINKNK